MIATFALLGGVFVLGARPVRTAKFAVWRRILPLGVVLACGACSIQQRAAEKLIDPQLLAQGQAHARERGGRDLQLGPYRAEEVERSEAAMAAEGGSRPAIEHRLRFVLRNDEDAKAWAADCTGVRRQPIDHDFAAAADESRDEVALRCTFTREGEAAGWQLELSGSLADNLFGELRPMNTEAETQSDPGEGKRVEVLMWHRVWKISRRPLPASFATVLGSEGTEAALILSVPERAWLGPELDAAARGLDMITLVALRLIPLGFSV